MVRQNGMDARKQSLYHTLAKWISLAVIGCSVGEFAISQRLSDRIDSLTLQRQATEVLKGYSAELRQRWRLKAGAAEGQARSSLQRLVDEVYISPHITPVLISAGNLFYPQYADGDIDLVRARGIIRELQSDDDQYVVNLSSRGPAFAAISAPLVLPGVQEDRVNLVLFMRWPLLQSLRELQWAALRLKALTLAVVVGSSCLLLYVLLGPLRRLSAKAKTLSSNNLLEGRLDPAGTPREIGDLIDSYNQAVERLDREYQDQQLFASTVSHEFKTPLTVINGFIDSVLLRAESITDRDRKKLEIAKNETHRLNRLVSDLLLLSRYGRNQLKLLNESFSPALVMKEVYAVLASAYPGRMHLDVDGEAEACEALGDPGRYAQVLTNLAENALKYSPASAPVTLRLRRDASKIISEIEDKGPGINLADQAKIFDRFFRAEAHRGLTQKPSSGLGLSIVKAMVESMGGAVGVESEPGQGSIFWVKLDRMDSDVSGYA